MRVAHPTQTVYSWPGQDMDKPSPKRKLLGNWGEQRAARFLQQQGYQILEQNYHCPWGEVDIVAQQDDCLVFIEVRTRKGESFGTPAESATSDKRERLIATAETYLQSLEAQPKEWRIDVITLIVTAHTRRAKLEHYVNAVELA